MSSELTRKIRAPYAKSAGMGSYGISDPAAGAWDNGYTQYARDANNNLVALIGTDPASGQPILGGQAFSPLALPIRFNIAANASIATQPFFLADQAYKITAITYVHATAKGSAGTAQIKRCADGVAVASGTSVQTNTFNLNGTADTQQNAVLDATQVSLAIGDRLFFVPNASVGSLAGVALTVWLTPANGIAPAVFQFNAAAGLTDQTFFMANRPLTITAVRFALVTPDTDAGTVTLNVKKDTGTTAAGGGTSILSGGTAVSIKDDDIAANTMETPALTATVATLLMAAGDRLSVDFTGVTDAAGAVVVVTFAPVFNESSFTFALKTTPGAADAVIFGPADRPYLVEDISAIWDVIATAGNLQVTIDSGTDAPGAGTDLLTDNSNAGFDLNATARTTYVGTLVTSRRSKIIPTGGRLGIDFATLTAGSFAGLAVAVTLSPA